MKIFANNKAYVQNNDLAYLMRGAEGISIPASIFNKVFGKVFIVTDENRYDFIEFSEPAEIEFFKECDWMVDYNAFDNMTEEEIIQIVCKINEERNKIAQAFNELKQQERKKQYQKITIRMIKLCVIFKTFLNFYNIFCFFYTNKNIFIILIFYLIL